MTVLSFTEKLKLGDSEQVMLYQGITSELQPFFAFLRCDRRGIERLHQDFEAQAKDVDINSYGQVIYLDFKAEPDDKAEGFLQAYMKRAALLSDA